MKEVYEAASRLALGCNVTIIAARAPAPTRPIDLHPGVVIIDYPSYLGKGMTDVGEDRG